MTNLSDFRKSNVRPPGPSDSAGYKHLKGDDNTRYILKPDTEFYRPWLATPGGSAFVWPGGVEGFTLSSSASAGIHHYLGQLATDVQLIYPDELHIVMNGTFMGNTSVTNMRALRSVILQFSTENGKILALPGIESQLQFVQVINHQFTHDQNDRSKDISYSIEFIKVGTGSTLKTQPLIVLPNKPALKIAPRGKSQARTAVKQHKQTIRSIAGGIWGDFSGDAMVKLIEKNKDEFQKAGIPLYKVPQSKLPLGLKLDFF